MSRAGRRTGYSVDCFHPVSLPTSPRTTACPEAGHVWGKRTSKKAPIPGFSCLDGWPAHDQRYRVRARFHVDTFVMFRVRPTRCLVFGCWLLATAGKIALDGSGLPAWRGWIWIIARTGPRPTGEGERGEASRAWAGPSVARDLAAAAQCPQRHPSPVVGGNVEPAYPIMWESQRRRGSRRAGKGRAGRAGSGFLLSRYRSPVSACCSCGASLASRRTARGCCLEVYLLLELKAQQRPPDRLCAFCQCIGTRRTRRRIGPSGAMAHTLYSQSIPAPCILAARDGAIPGEPPPRGGGGWGAQLDSCPSRIRVSYGRLWSLLQGSQGRITLACRCANDQP